MDFIFALPTQTFEDLKSDIDTAFAIGANHAAIYPFIDFTFTESTIKPTPKKEKRRPFGRYHAILRRAGIYARFYLDILERKRREIFLYDKR